MKILGIETSCDETAIAMVEASGGAEAPVFKLLGSSVQSQIKLHAEYGGVYPTLAKREHIKNLPLVLEEALKNANSRIEDMDRIAVTVGPGLEPALWTGINFAKELSEKYNIPLIPANHMEGHIASVLLNKTEEIRNSKSEARKKFHFPIIALLISGGHTELVYMENWKDKKMIGQTKDDAVGEAFDKVARMLGLPYPGGPEISALAEKARQGRALKFPRPMINSGDLDFSFSGLKTAVLYYIRDQKEIDENHKAQIAREFEDAVTEVLLKKSIDAINKYNPKTFIIGGGVIANNKIRESFEEMGRDLGISVMIPEKLLSTDNAVMIAMSGYLSCISGKVTPLSAIEFGKTVKALGNLKI